MNVKLAFTLSAIAWVLFGLPFVILPAFALSMFNITLDIWGLFMVRLFGGALLGFAVIGWLVRNGPASETRRVIILGESVHSTIATCVFIYGLTIGFASILSYVPFLLHLIFAIWFGFLYYKGAK